jgi:hypothetical protein
MKGCKRVCEHEVMYSNVPRSDSNVCPKTTKPGKESVGQKKAYAVQESKVNELGWLNRQQIFHN